MQIFSGLDIVKIEVFLALLTQSIICWLLGFSALSTAGLAEISCKSMTPKLYTSLNLVKWQLEQYAGSRYPGVPLIWLLTCD